MTDTPSAADALDYYYDDIGTTEQKIGRKIYQDSLSDRRGFRHDQLEIDTEDEIWLEIFGEIGKSAIKNTRAATLKCWK